MAGVMPFTVAFVPTETKAGVCTVPCGVSKMPARPSAPSIFFSIVNFIGFKSLENFRAAYSATSIKERSFTFTGAESSNV